MLTRTAERVSRNTPQSVQDRIRSETEASPARILAAGPAAIAARISEFGLSPNRVAALGENVILLVNLGWSAVLYIRFLRGRRPFSDLERWQTNYLPVYAVWAAIVVIVFPPLFRYL